MHTEVPLGFSIYPQQHLTSSEDMTALPFEAELREELQPALLQSSSTFHLFERTLTKFTYFFILITQVTNVFVLYKSSKELNLFTI